MKVTKPLIIEARLNEKTMRSGNDALPYTPEEVIADAQAVYEAGASMVHWHARDAMGVEHPNSVEMNAEIIRGIKASTPLLLHPTMGFIGTQNNASARVAQMDALQASQDTRVDVVPVDMGAFIADRWDAERRVFKTADVVMTNKVDYLHDLLTSLQQTKTMIMSVVWGAGAVRTALAFQEAGLIGDRTFWELGFTGETMPGGPPATASNLESYLELIPSVDEWTVLVMGGDAMEIAAQAIMRGGHVSIGLGDHHYDRFGKPTNADLIAKVADMARIIGRPIADTEQARKMLAL
ncbi:3-keto-5-aminohexanoate cleavage protein [Rhodococcus sp. NPDC057529]|uniref:3-keto-5-aminohexanoate cleavage protein n=1 Tax=Rhodococcus sp. NPDC057529 TaxID=3346158 RepID=UPI003671436C